MSVNSSPAAKAVSPISATASGTAFRLRPITVQRLAAVAFVALIMAAWTFASTKLPPVLMPSPARVWNRFQSIWTDPVFLGYALTTLWHVVVCVSLAFVMGVGIAVLTYFAPPLNRAVYGRLTPFLNSFSGLGWAFLAVVWFGVQHGAVLFAATVALLPFAIINAGAGLRELNQESVEMSLSFTRSRGRRTFLVILPMLVPYLFATLRLCSAIGWHIVPTAELLTGAGGLGTLISIARQRFWTDMIFAIALLDVIMVLVTDRLLFARLQKWMKNYYVA